MLGFGGNFLTKARRYSITFRALRDARALFRRLQALAADDRPDRCQEGIDSDTVLVLNGLSYAGSGWLWVPVIHPCWSGSVPVLVEGAAEPIASADI
jgi:hypothetical protein